MSDAVRMHACWQVHQKRPGEWNGEMQQPRTANRAGTGDAVARNGCRATQAGTVEAGGLT